MEHSTSAVNWQPVNPPKAPGELRRDSLTHVAYGSDAVSYFQWRASVAGAEKYHSAMLPHAGSDSQLFRDVCALGGELSALREVVGTQAVPAQVAIVFDWTSWWACELDSHPSSLLRYREAALAWHEVFAGLGIEVDVQPVAADLSPYLLVVAPLLHVVDDATRSRLTGYVEDGGHLLTTFFSGTVDQDDHIHLGGYPGALRDLLGIRVEELAPLLPGHTRALNGGGEATLLAETVHALDAEVVLTYEDGAAAATRRVVGAGSASYLGCWPDSSTLAGVVGSLAHQADVEPELDPLLDGGVTRRVRAAEDREFVFLINHTASPQVVAGQSGVDLLTGNVIDGDAHLAPYGVVVLST
jgi:beta-galactosidase